MLTILYTILFVWNTLSITFYLYLPLIRIYGSIHDIWTMQRIARISPKLTLVAFTTKLLRVIVRPDKKAMRAPIEKRQSRPKAK